VVRGEAEHFFCVVICLKWRKADMFMSKVVNLTGLLGDIKEDWGSRGRKSPSEAQKWSPGRGSQKLNSSTRS